MKYLDIFILPFA